MTDQTSFFSAMIAQALRDASVDPPFFFADQAVARFGVYRNNVYTSLSEALKEVYPAVERLLGPVYFRALSQEFIKDTLPRSPVLSRYGAEFPDFISSFPPLKSYPYLGDVARLEWFWLRAYHARDSLPLHPENLQKSAPEDMAKIGFTRHPSATLLCSSFPCYTLFRRNRPTKRGGFSSADSHKPDWSKAQNVMIVRPYLDVLVTEIDTPTAVLFTELSKGHPIGYAAAQCEETFGTEFSLQNSFSLLLTQGVFTSCTTRCAVHENDEL